MLCILSTDLLRGLLYQTLKVFTSVLGNNSDLKFFFLNCKLTLREFVKDVFRFELMLRRRGSLQVMSAMPAVRFRTMCCAAMCMRWMSGSKLKSYTTTESVIITFT